MKRFVARLCLAIVFALGVFGAARPAAATLLPDSTEASSWKLANGLEVRTRHVPGAAGIAIAVSYRAGSTYEPADRPGLTELLAEVEFTAAAGDVPARTREEMTSLRPLGWGLTTSPQLVTLTEIASREQFPGVLRQVATRMRGVTVDAAVLDAARATVRADLARNQFGDPALALYYRSREIARGMSDEAIVRRASGSGIAGATPATVGAELKSRCVPANASLAIAGDLSGIDVRTLVEHEFGAIAAGAATHEKPDDPLAPGTRVTTLDGIGQPFAVVGVLAPALDDSLHPAFWLATAAMGGWFREQLGPPPSPLTSRFQFSLLDEPDLARFYPDVPPGQAAVPAIQREMSLGFDQLAETAMPGNMLDLLRRSIAWLVGGPMPPSVLESARANPGALGTLANSMARRALWRGDAFWNDYLRRVLTTRYSHNIFTPWMDDPKHQVTLVFLPRK